MLTHGSRQPRSWLIFDVGRKTRMSKPGIKLMADYHCSPLWRYGGVEVGNVDAEELGVSEVLAAKLERWAATYDSHLNVSDPATTAWTQEEEKQFDAEGRSLCRELNAEIGRRFSVFYFDRKSASCVPVDAL